MSLNKLEREFFRRLNAVVEPAVGKGLGSPRIAVAGHMKPGPLWWRLAKNIAAPDHCHPWSVHSPMLMPNAHHRAGCSQFWCPL